MEHPGPTWTWFRCRRPRCRNVGLPSAEVVPSRPVLLYFAEPTKAPTRCSTWNTRAAVEFGPGSAIREVGLSTTRGSAVAVGSTPGHHRRRRHPLRCSTWNTSTTVGLGNRVDQGSARRVDESEIRGGPSTSSARCRAVAFPTWCWPWRSDRARAPEQPAERVPSRAFALFVETRKTKSRRRKRSPRSLSADRRV